MVIKSLGQEDKFPSKLRHGHKTQRFHSSFGGEPVQGKVGVNTFTARGVVKSNYGVGDGYKLV